MLYRPNGIITAVHPRVNMASVGRRQEKFVSGEGLLDPYRVLDLSEGGINLAGKLLADLGADVLRVEPPAGSDTRCRGPFHGGEPHPERSLFWFAFNLNKRGITLDLARPRGRALLRELALRADAIIESGGPAAAEAEALAQADPGLVHVSVTPFGRSGPYASYESTDLVLWALSGLLYLSGHPDRPPVRISQPLAEAVAGSHAAAGAMHALFHRNRTGRGQRVDVAELVSAVWTNMGEAPHGTVAARTLHREGEFRNFGYTRFRQLYRCRDGFIACMTLEGIWGAAFNRRLATWMLEEGRAPPFFEGFPWEEWNPATKVRAGRWEEAMEEVRRVEEPMAAFFATKTKQELFEGALARELLLAPVFDTADLFRWEQLEARDFWVALGREEEGLLRYPGPFARFSETPVRYRRPAPRIGEHNFEVYVDELGHSPAELAAWRAEGVV